MTVCIPYHCFVEYGSNNIGKDSTERGHVEETAKDGQRQIALVMTIDRLSYTLKHKRGNLAMWPSGAQIIYQIESVPFLNVTSCRAVFSPLIA